MCHALLDAAGGKKNAQSGFQVGPLTHLRQERRKSGMNIGYERQRYVSFTVRSKDGPNRTCRRPPI
ncbi:MAG: hypothetical protein V1778_01830 [bacterium]